MTPYNEADPITLEAFLSVYDQKVQALCYELRAVAKRLLPDCEEIIYIGWKNITFGTRTSGAGFNPIIYIAPMKGSVNLGFWQGAFLKDPDKLLKGTGKKLRHIKVKSLEDCVAHGIQELVIEAYKQAQLSPN